MKNLLKENTKWAAILATILLVTLAPATVQAEDPIRVALNGEQVHLNPPPQLVDNRTLVPVRGLFEAMGFEVIWDSTTQTAHLVRDALIIDVTVGRDVLHVREYGTDKITTTLDVPAQLIGDRTFIPLRAIAEATGAGVEWRGATI